MIFVDDIPFATSQFQMVRGRQILASLLDHPAVLSSSDRLKGTPEKKVSSAERPPPGRLVYVFQREYATVDPALVQVNRNHPQRTSVSHMDFPGVVDNGLAQMLSSIADSDDDSDEASFDVHIIGGFDDGPKRHPINATVSERKQKKEGFSLPLCSKLIEALHNSQQKFHLQTLCVLRHNTKLDSCGNACPIVSGFLVDTSSDSIMPASFDRSSRGPDEIVRRIRVSLSSDDSNWKGRLLDTYDTCHDRFEIAPCTWMSDWKSYASSLQQLSDSEFLLRCSTSPYAEAPDFVESERRKWNYLIENPDWRHTFTGKKPRIFQRTDDGGWSKCA